MLRLVSAFAVALGSFAVAIPDPVNPDPNSPRPIDAVDSVFIEELTWIEVRDAMRDGKRTVIVPTGGVEQSGPYLVTGKHNVVLRGTTEAIARRLGNALVAPTLPFVPQGDIDPPTVHMRYPGTIGLTEETYERVLVDVCASFRATGFKHIVLIGDSGGNQDGLQAVAERLNREWGESKSRVHYVPEYYNYKALAEWLEQQGIDQVPEGLHDDFAITAMMLAVDPKSVRMQQRVAADRFRINGIELAPAEKTIAWGKKIIDYRAQAAVNAIRRKTRNDSSGR